jgi:hypothetical protein
MMELSLTSQLLSQIYLKKTKLKPKLKLMKMEQKLARRKRKNRRKRLRRTTKKNKKLKVRPISNSPRILVNFFSSLHMKTLPSRPARCSWIHKSR